jgi:hypothetical protein
MLRERKVTLSYFPAGIIGLFGLLLWSFPLVFYSISLSFASGTVRNIWLSNIVLHFFSGILVDIDVVFFSGTFWPLQTIIIGVSSYITFTLPALLAYNLSINDERGVMMCIFSLASACLANAVLISILFEYFHRSVKFLTSKVELQNITAVVKRRYK